MESIGSTGFSGNHPYTRTNQFLLPLRANRQYYFAISTEKRYLLQKITLKKDSNDRKTISQWVEERLATGAFGFSVLMLKSALPGHSRIALKRSLSRLSEKGEIISVYKGYYLIIPPQYRSRGTLPPALFIDSLMAHLERPYYMALLSAATYHGAGHQQPQEFFVITGFPVMRPIRKKGLKINFISIRRIPEHLLVRMKTEAGYLNISSPILTACDLVKFSKRVGGMNRVAAVLEELVSDLPPSAFFTEAFGDIPVATLQRLGYLLEHVCGFKSHADALFDATESRRSSFFRLPLKASGIVHGNSVENRWKVAANVVIDIEN